MRRSHSDGDLGKMRESWSEWPREKTTTLKRETSPMKSDTEDIAEKGESDRPKVCCCRCGVPLTPSKGSEGSSNKVARWV